MEQQITGSDHGSGSTTHSLAVFDSFQSSPQSPRLRRLLLDIESIFLREGFAGFSSMDEIARRLHCSKMTLYRIASSREDLFVLIIELWLHRARTQAHEQMETATSWREKFEGFLSIAFTSTRDASFAFLRDVNAFPRGQLVLAEHQASRVRELEQLISDGARHNAFANVHPRLVAEMWEAMASRIVDPEFLRSVGLSAQDAFEEWHAMLLYGLDGECRVSGKTPPRRRRRSRGRAPS
jgi:AcrR family transcriptional regulator